MSINGALLINKHAGVSSFGVIEILQRQLVEKQGIKRQQLPKLGHGGTLDPFATGTLIVLVGHAVKLARYFLGATKSYEGVILFGETTIPGDPTEAISETCEHLPTSIDELNDLAHRLTLQPYLQTPPMHSAKKKNGKPLYELARAGIDIEREAKECQLYDFSFSQYHAPEAHFKLKCSSGTYVRTLAQDFAKLLNTVALVKTLHRTSSGIFEIAQAWSAQKISEATQAGTAWDQLPCWVPFDRLLNGYDRAEATTEEREALIQGKQNVLLNILRRTQSPTHKSSERDDCITIYTQDSLVAIARKTAEVWHIERVFVRS